MILVPPSVLLVYLVMETSLCSLKPLMELRVTTTTSHHVQEEAFCQYFKALGHHALMVNSAVWSVGMWCG